MIEEELHQLINKIQHRGCEWQTTEVKAAHRGCPEKLYDTISAFANQDSGGILVFGLDEKTQFAKVGVYDAQALQKKVVEYCEQMTPVVRPVFTVCDEEGKVFVSAEIPPLDVAERPCFRSGKGRLKGSYIRVGDADIPMTEYEVYSYEAFRRNHRDDIRPAGESATLALLDKDMLDIYLATLRKNKPNLSRLPEEQQQEFGGITRNGEITLAAWMLFGLFPQVLFPRLYIAATCIPGTELGETDAYGNRFTDSKRIEGTIPEMLEKALDFVSNNMNRSTRIDDLTGRRVDEYAYPLKAIREAVLNALVHRDYSIHTETRPIQLNMYTDRLEIINPGGLYGRLRVDQLGHTQPDTRNPMLVTAMETLGLTENRYSGIPTIRRAMEQHGLSAPVFVNTGGEFRVVLYKAHAAPAAPAGPAGLVAAETGDDAADDGLLAFCRTPRTRAELLAHLQVGSWPYAFQRYINPLLKQGLLQLTIPETPRSHSQRYVAVTRY